MRSRKRDIFSDHRIILVLADCLQGAMEAGRFAIRNLYNSNSRILLLQTYQNPRFGQSMLRNISPMLKRVAKEELRRLKNELIEEFELSPGSIDTKTFEGRLSSILKNQFGIRPDLSAVLGYDPNQSFRPFPCRNVIRAVIESGIRPLFVVSDSITLIDSGNIFLFAEDEQQVRSDYFSFLEKLKNKSRIKMTKHTINNPGEFIPTRETASHFNAADLAEINNMTRSEVLLRKELHRLNITQNGS